MYGEWVGVGECVILAGCVWVSVRSQPDFFFHENPMVERAALEVYIRRAYVAYVLSSVENRDAAGGQPVLLFQVRLL